MLTSAWTPITTPSAAPVRPTRSPSDGRRRSPRPSTAPTPIEPRYDWPQVATDDQILAVLDRVKPPKAPHVTNNMVHALRLWGPKADFGDPQIPTGAQMRDYFVDDRVFQQLAPAGSPPIFEVQPDGEVRVRSYARDSQYVTTSSYHTADLLATMGEIGLPPDTPLVTRNGTATIGDLVRSAMGRYHYEQFEYEWSTISYARYVFPLDSFRNKFGETMTTRGIMTDLVRLPGNLGACNGTHRIEAMVVLNRADDTHQALSPNEKRFALQYLASLSATLAASSASSIASPPLSRSSAMVRAARSIRVASVTRPSSTGTLRSTRTSTRLPDATPVMTRALDTA